MFDLALDQRLEFWLKFRRSLESSTNPLQEVWDLWRLSPFIQYNSLIDPYNAYSWPTPWEIIEDNRYDEFTRALMMAWTLKMTDKFKDSAIFLKTMVDTGKKRQYNIVCIDNNWVLNYSDTGPVGMDFIPESFSLENLIEVRAPR